MAPKSKYDLERENINPYTGKPYQDVPAPVDLTDEEIRAKEKSSTGEEKKDENKKSD